MIIERLMEHLPRLSSSSLSERAQNPNLRSGWQNGRFDAPDRLFASVADSWESVLSNPADLKELIPEFYAPPSDFLVKRCPILIFVVYTSLPFGRFPVHSNSFIEFDV